MHLADADSPVVIKKGELGEASRRENQAEIDIKPEDAPYKDQKEIMDKLFKETVEELNLPLHEPIKFQTNEDEDPYPDKEKGFGGDEILYAKFKDTIVDGEFEFMEPGGLDVDFIGFINIQLTYFEEISFRERAYEYVEAVEQQYEGDNLEEALRVKAYVVSDSPDEIDLGGNLESLEQGETVPGERHEVLATIRKKIYGEEEDAFFDKKFRDELYEVVQKR
eukprot:snap_masked-scaffold_28-processed-gene-1.24-mRNA-1 protein AED:1.00 eAED:1.00 QI:0/-1/0/0/-1/1/1/0/221